MKQQFDQELISKFGTRVRELRKEKGMTIEELAERSGLTKLQIGRIERGQVNTSIDSCNRIAIALGLSISQLFVLDEE